MNAAPTPPKKLSPRKVKAHAKKIFQFLFHQTYRGEVYLCGGAFKPLLDPTLQINDLDLWVRGRNEREHLLAALLAAGAKPVQGSSPHGTRLIKNGTAIEISDHDAGDRGVAGIVASFDIAACAIGAAYDHGTIRDVFVNRRTNRMLKQRTVLLQDSYIPRLRAEHAPGLLCGIDRMQQLAADTGFEVDESSRAEIWEIFENEYSPEEKQRCLDTYLETISSDRQQGDPEVLRRASDLVLQSS